MNLLIIGANSFIGRNLISYLKELQIREFCLLKNKVSDIDFYNVDIVLHLSALVHQMNGESEENYFKINKDLLFEVAKRAKENGVRQFIFMSTIKVYGESTDWDSSWNEHTNCKPIDSYGKSKLAAEKELLKLEDNNFIVSIIRSPLVYGKGVKGNMLNIIKLVDRFFLLPFNGIQNKRSMVFVGNLVEMIHKIIEKKASGIFIPNDPEPVSTSQIFNEIAKAFKKSNKIIRFPRLVKLIIKYLKPEVYNRLFKSLVVDDHLTQERLSYQPKYSFSYGIKEMVNAYKQNDND